MLADFERKLLRILYNDTRFGGCVPSINKLAIRIGKHPNTVPRVLRSLVDKGYNVWSPDRREHLQVIKAWDDDPQKMLRMHEKKLEPWETESF